MEAKGSALIGRLLEQRYRVDALLAHGGMSSVYRGLDTRLDRPVAIKVMDPRFAADPAFVERFEREARSAAKIHHPNVVAVHDQGLDGDHVFLVMELVQGGTLRDLLAERGALPAPLAVSIMEPVLSALSAAHRAGLIHRDVKPENVLIGTGGVVKVADFGLVRAIHSPGTTKSSVILGTVSYLSPEQVTTGAATSRGDVYSSGILLYEMLTGAAPYRGENALSVAYRHVNDDVPAPSGSAHGVPPLLDDLVVRCTRRDPEARPADGAGFLVELQHVRTALNLPRMRVPVPTPLPVEELPGPDVGTASGVLPVQADPAQVHDGQDAVETAIVPATPPAGAPAQWPTEDVDPEATVRVRPVPAPAPQGATVVRPVVPAGYSAAGPQGTRAMLRSDLERVAERQQATQYPPSGPQPLPPAGPPPPQTGAHPAQAQPRRRRPRWLVPVIAGVLAVAVLATGIWWFSAGRYTDVPRLVGQQASAAEQAVRDAGLTPKLTSVRDNSVEAGRVISTDPGEGAELLRGDQVEIVVSKGKPVVPDITPGTSPDQAEQTLRDAELQPQRDDGKNAYDDKVAKGTVIRLEPPSGTQVDIGQRVVVVLSKGPAPKPVPDVRNKTRDEAYQLLTSAGFQPFDAPAEFSDAVDTGRVIKTTPAQGTQVEADGDKRVYVTLSNAVTVPDLNQKTVGEARALLQQLGLSLKLQLPSGDNGRIFTQSPGAGSRVAQGTEITVFAFFG
ncbi:Stk1 family PASTA domain-containing Ser/Thr kinase [Actinokineospora bangkokensis]|uniref:Stk1 family PASTA domain-containing Ser/Thr kinase n=1 Tax=Actinokineospora bangkokensis TaxID=1193682 RepID=UPI000A076491|nr:Stk1 family PASTA domain-containing Ser/Thr kinase [Actinokineospora bangkokensis]